MRIIWLSQEDSYKIYINKNTIEEYELDESLPLILSFGYSETEMDIIEDDSIPNDCIALNNFISSKLSIPYDIPYEVMVSGQTVKIGPVIGMMAMQYKSSITEELLNELGVRFINYPIIKGLLFVFAERGINTDTETIEGYYYNPSSENHWKYGVFPYPSSIVINRTDLSQKMYKHLRSRIGETIFYSHIPTKWYQYRLLKNHNSLRKVVPKTIQFTGMKSVLKMLQAYGSVYLKPNSSFQGKGIVYIERMRDGYMVKDEYNNVFEPDTLDGVKSILREKIKGNYLIQQSIPFQYENQNIDFRVYLQKNRYKKWVSPGITTRIAKAGSIITNTRNRQKVIASTEALTSYYGLTEEEAKELEEEMVDICTRIAIHVEDQGIHQGDAAFDVIVDSNLKIWVLEFQGGYSVEKKLHEIPIDILSRMVGTPFEYAKTLTGFW